MLRNVEVVPLEQATEDAFDCIASQMKIPRSDIIQTVLRGWLEARLDLPIPTDEDNDTNQRA